MKTTAERRRQIGIVAENEPFVLLVEYPQPPLSLSHSLLVAAALPNRARRR